MKKVPENQGLMSMTGFGSVQGSVDNLSWSGDIRSVNGRSLELRLRLPEFDGLESEVRKRLQKRLARGNVTVQIRLQRDEREQSTRLSEDGLKAALIVLGDIETAAQSVGITLGPVTAADIATMRGVVELSDAQDADSEQAKLALLDSFDAGLSAFVSDRQREGAAIHAVLKGQIKRMDELIAQASELIADREMAARDALKRNIDRILDVTEVPDETRLAQELALLAVKSDVKEELDRLLTHVDAARALLELRQPVGRKLDFLMQEFNREANTLCSKAQSSALTAVGLELKAVIDQMREQVQNIE